MFFDDKSFGGAAKNILTSNKDGTLTNKMGDEPATGDKDHELLVHELHDSVHGRDVQGTYDAMHALFCHFQAKQQADSLE